MPNLSQFTEFVRRQKYLSAGLALAIGLGLVSLYSMGPNEGKPQPPTKQNRPAVPPLDKFITHETAKKIPDISVQTADGRATALASQFNGLTLVNFWATWCAPCRKEMPQLDALAARYADKGVHVITLSVDRGGADKGEKFLNDLAVAHVTRLYDPSYKSARAVALIGLPTTLLVNAKGEEIGRLAGEADWDAPPVHALLDYYLEN